MSLRRVRSTATAYGPGRLAGGVATVRLDGMLRQFGASANWQTSASTVTGLLDELETEFPRLRSKLRDETGELRRFVRVFVNGEDIRNGAGAATAIAPSDRVDILHSIQGG